ncbi:NAD(P)-binding protein, partial [Ceraceosorus guamensis]
WATVRWRNGTWSVKRLTRKEWAQQIVVVTGGSSGMGKSIVDCMIRKGAKVVSLDILPAKDEAGITNYICDISERVEVEKVAAQIRQEIGHPTVLINNAGIQNNRLLIDLDDQEIDRMLNINLKSHFYTIQAFLPDMIRRGKGHVVLTSSVMGYVGVSQMSDYVATKHALVGLLESLRYELDKKHRVPKVRTSLVILGHVRTALFSGAQFGPLASFLAPTVEAEQVAQEITAAVERQESTHIALPFYANLVPWLKVVPTFLRDLAQWVSRRRTGAFARTLDQNLREMHSDSLVVSSAFLDHRWETRTIVCPRLLRMRVRVRVREAKENEMHETSRSCLCRSDAEQAHGGCRRGSSRKTSSNCSKMRRNVEQFANSESESFL